MWLSDVHKAYQNMSRLEPWIAQNTVRTLAGHTPCIILSLIWCLKSVAGKERYQMLYCEVEIRCLVRSSSQIQPQRRGPGMSQSFYRQGPHFCPRTVPDLFPSSRMDFLNQRYWPLSHIWSPATISFRPLPSPKPDIRLGSKTTTFRSPTIERSNDIFDTVRVKDRYWSIGRTVVKGVCALVESWRNWRECGKDGRGIWTARQESCETSAIGFAASIETRPIYCICFRYGLEHIEYIWNLDRVSSEVEANRKRLKCERIYEIRRTSSTVLFS